MGNFKQNFGKRIQTIRKSKNLTQEKLAEKIGLDTPNLSNIERGKHFVSAETLEKLAVALEVPENELFTFDYMKNKKELLNYLIDELSNLTDKELTFFYRILKSYKETIDYSL